VQGQIRVNVQVDYAAFMTPDSLRVLLDNTAMCTYPLTASNTRATFACTINTAELNPATGGLRFPNGARTLQARMYRGTLVIATTQTQLVFNN
jgi:hypothetical protein